MMCSEDMSYFLDQVSTHKKKTNYVFPTLLFEVKNGKQGFVISQNYDSIMQVPGCFFFLGSALDMKDIRPHHKSVFDIDERCLAVGASIWIRLVDNLLCSE